MKQTLVDLFTSKKFLAAVTAIVMYVAGRFGFDVDTAVLDRVLAAFLVYIGAQGIADNGKSSALILAGRSPAVSTTAPGLGTASMLAVLLLGALAAPAMVGCATGKAALAEGSVAFLECEDAHLDPQALADVKALATAELRHLIAGAAAPDTAALKADLAPIKSDLGRCGWAGAVAALGALVPPPAPGVATSALTAGPDPVRIRVAFAVAARSLGWAPVRVAGGEVL